MLTKVTELFGRSFVLLTVIAVANGVSLVSAKDPDEIKPIQTFSQTSVRTAFLPDPRLFLYRGEV